MNASEPDRFRFDSLENGTVYYIFLDMLYSMLDMGRRLVSREELGTWMEAI